jgi:hypothetical protein
MATSKGGIKSAAKKKTPSIKQGPTVGKTVKAAAKAVTTRAKKIAGTSKKKSATAPRGTKKTMAKKSLSMK